MSAVTDMPKATGNQKREEWKAATSPAVAAYYERRKKAAQLQAEREATKGHQITEAEYQSRKARVGRPPKYKPEYCQTVLKLSEEGLSLTAIAGRLGVTRDTLWDWGQKHKEFSNALKVAKPIRTAALETSMLAEDSGPRINARIFALKNAAPEEWSDKQNIEINQTVNVAVTFSNVLDSLCSAINGATTRNDINELIDITPNAVSVIEARNGVKTGLDRVERTETETPLGGDHLGPVDIEYTSSFSTETSSLETSSFSAKTSTSSPQASKKIQKKQNDARLKKAAYQREYMRKRRAAARTRSDVAPSDSEVS